MTTPTPMQDALLQNVPTIEGYKVLGKTVLLACVGSGGMGVVYSGWHMTFRIHVAVKVLKAALAADRAYLVRFRHEAEASLRITHQHVVRAYDVEERHGLHYLVLEFVDGESATQRVRRLGRMPAREAITVITAAAAGLAEAHGHGLVHRDVKPSNVLIARSGRVKIADLGLVRPALEARQDAASGDETVVLGTQQYMAPEQWGSRDVHPAADVWAVGATLYFLLTGEHGVPRLPTAQLRQWVQQNPFPTLRARCPDLPAELHAIYERCVQRDPDQRFENAGRLHTALQALGPHDEAVLSDRDHDPVGVASELPPQEVLGRIDARLKGAAQQQPLSRPQPQPRSQRHTPAPARRRPAPKRSALPLAVLVLAGAIVAIVVLTRGGDSRDGVAAVPTASAPPTDDPMPAPAPQPLPAVPETPPGTPAPRAAPSPAAAAAPADEVPPEPATEVAPPTIEWQRPEIGVPMSGKVTVEVAVASTVPIDAVRIGNENASCAAPVHSGTSHWSADVELAAAGRPIVVQVAYAAGKTTSIESARVGVDLADSAVATTIGIVVQPIRPAEFRIGASLVQISRPFWIAENEVSRGQWRVLMPAVDEAADDGMPVANIPWSAAVEFCRRLTLRERASGRLPKGYEYGLPPEVWWECACRANDDGAPPARNDELVRVHEGKPGAARLRNMHGNVAEWCADNIASAAWPPTVRDPIATGRGERVARGAAYTDLEQPSAQLRQGWPEATAKKKIGFRIALLPLPTGK
ncbi:MAG TPA: bifunctional serine/threonine-protein kinase/formylglycine-generating enzyme family protein [Planctomycetota bacterium]|nr:bifunctional serine/threonine-protein kinase/formylglycine-generating enzyme family protein [Planctomycetota bacterium]